MRRLLCAAMVAGTIAASLVVGVGPASAATVITAPTGNPFVVPGNAGGDPLPFTVTTTGFAADTSVYIEQCDGVSPTAIGWDPTTNCDLGSSPAPVVSDLSAISATNVSLGVLVGSHFELRPRLFARTEHRRCEWRRDVWIG